MMHTPAHKQKQQREPPHPYADFQPREPLAPGEEFFVWDCFSVRTLRILRGRTLGKVGDRQLTYRALGVELGIGPERVRQIYLRAMKRVWRYLPTEYIRSNYDRWERRQ